MNRDGYRDQIVTHDVGVSLHSKTHPLFMKYSNGTSTQCYAYHYPSLFPVLFLQSLYVPFLIQRIFHLLVQYRVRAPILYHNQSQGLGRRGGEEAKTDLCLYVTVL